MVFIICVGHNSQLNHFFTPVVSYFNLKEEGWVIFLLQPTTMKGEVESNLRPPYWRWGPWPLGQPLIIQLLAYYLVGLGFFFHFFF